MLNGLIRALKHKEDGRMDHCPVEERSVRSSNRWAPFLALPFEVPVGGGVMLKRMAEKSKCNSRPHKPSLSAGLIA